jgi:hypothetical protein
MAHLKVFAHRALIVAAFVGFFSVASVGTAAAVGVAIHLAD